MSFIFILQMTILYLYVIPIIRHFSPCIVQFVYNYPILEDTNSKTEIFYTKGVTME